MHVVREGGAPGLVSLEQPLLRALVDEAQPVRVEQARTPTEPEAAADLDEAAHHLPAPVGRVDAELRRPGLHHDSQAGLSLRPKAGMSRRSARRAGRLAPPGSKR